MKSKEYTDVYTCVNIYIHIYCKQICRHTNISIYLDHKIYKINVSLYIQIYIYIHIFIVMMKLDK